MSDRRFRDELRDVFDSLSEPAHPALSARVREHIAAGSAPPASRVPRFAVAVAAVVAIAVVAGLVYVGRGGGGPGGVPAGRPGPTSAATAVPSPSPEPSLSPTPTTAATPAPSASTPAPTPAGGLPAFSCSAQSGSGATGFPVGVTAVRAGAQSGFDRFVIELNGPPGSYTVTPQSTATFGQDPSDQKVTLSGSAGLRVVLQGVQEHGTYTGPSDLKPSGTATLREARSIGDFEGVVSWGLGLSKPACFRAFTLSGPFRLVVDVQS